MTLKPLKISSLSLNDLSKVSQLCSCYPLLNWNESKFKETLANPQTLAFGLFYDDKLICLMLLNHIFDEAELLVIATHPDFCNQGYAFELLQSIIAQLQQRKIKQIFLEVREGNAAAIKLYQRCGFKTIHVRKDYYANPKENALVMQLSFADN